MSFVCTGKKEGEADITFSLNYTTIESGLVGDNIKTFDIVVRRRCLQTGMCFLVGSFVTS